MKIYIGKYHSWFGPHQLAEALCFWAKDTQDENGIPSKPNWVDKFGVFLAHGIAGIKNYDDTNYELPETWLYRFLMWIDSKRKRRVSIRIDKYDTWNMDRTLAMIILPMLKQLKDTKHGSAYVDDDDVPESLRNLNHEDDYDSIHARWDWVISEMIWAFEQHQPDYDWHEQYSTGVCDLDLEPHEFDENNKAKTYSVVYGPKHTYDIDWDGCELHQKRIDNGFRLFGKYYQGLWD